MLKADWKARELFFHSPAGTSRGVLKSKPSILLLVWNEDEPHIKGIGECSLIPGLSMEAPESIGEKVDELCRNIHDLKYWQDQGLVQYPSLRFALETALLDLEHRGARILFPSEFTIGRSGIPINGLVWMGDKSEMKAGIAEKLKSGFRCLKIKIGAIAVKDELELLRGIRKEFNEKDLVLRVDSNGAFTPDEALDILKKLADLKIHSIEQPIAAGRYEAMAELCEKTPIPIALDEDLIGKLSLETKRNLLDSIKPQNIVLKPSLVGGFKSSEQWIELAEERKIGWWITSALESNIGLNAIAQWTATLNSKMYQGLGTGQLFSNNFESPLEIEKGKLFYRPEKSWQVDDLLG